MAKADVRGIFKEFLKKMLNDSHQNSFHSIDVLILPLLTYKICETSGFVVRDLFFGSSSNDLTILENNCSAS